MIFRSAIAGTVAGAAVTLGSIGFDKRFYPIMATMPIATALYVANQLMGKPLEKIHDALNSPGTILSQMLESDIDESLDLIDGLVSEIYDVQ